ncbi:MAG: hypothetical protein KAI20_04370 [Thermoplasmatales archaeon]|nr:hypothetical protein [Thermoplasmatales archaeon]
MKISCNLNIEYDDSKKAEKILRSIKVDDFDFVKSKIHNKSLEATITSKSVSSLLHTLDDYLSCLSVAEKIVDKN